MKRMTAKLDARQQESAARYMELTGLHLERAPGGVFSPVDYLARKSPRYGEPVIAVLELKFRENHVDTYFTVWCEARKVRALRQWASSYAATGWFVVEWTDGTMRQIEVERLIETSGEPVMRSRTLKTRDDAADTDLVYEVPVVQMERLCGSRG